MTSPSSVLRTNRNFRLLFLGQAISQLGDWFNSVAVFALLLDLTGSATAVAWMMIVQFLPMAIVGPMAGVVVDRVDRRRLMIAADLFRGVLILGLLLIHRRDQVWIAYVVTAVPDHRAVMQEIIRVARPGARVVLLNHFVNGSGLLAVLERAVSPVCKYIGFRTDLSVGQVLEGLPLEVTRHEKVKPLKLWHLVECRNAKTAVR